MLNYVSFLAGTSRHTALQKSDCRPSIDQFGDEAGELGGCEFVIMLIILGVVARSRYGSGRIGSTGDDQDWEAPAPPR